VIEDLLRRPGPDLARWAVEQARSLSRPGTNVQRLQIYQVAGALSSASVEDKQELVRNAIAGFAELPPDQKAEALRLVVNTAAAAQVQAAGVPDPESSPLMQNVMAVVQEAKFHEMPKQEQELLAKEAREDAMEMMKPEQLLEVVAELKPEERDQVTEALIEAKIVPEEQQGVLHEALRPGGAADLLVNAMKFISFAQENSGALVAVPFGELFLALLLGVLPCRSGLATWLRADAVYSVLTLAGAWLAGTQLAPAIQCVKEDPMGVAQRWEHAQAQNQTLRRRLEVTVPGVEFHAYQLGAIGVLVTGIFLAAGLLNAVVGLFELFATVVAGCSIVVMVASMGFLALRCVMVFGLLQALAMIVRLASSPSHAPLLQEHE